jgi:hypothetical protein
MKKLSLMFLILTNQWASAYAPPVDFLLGEMAKQCITGKASFVGMRERDEGVSFISARLENSAFLLSNQVDVKEGERDQKASQDNKDYPVNFLSLLMDCKNSNLESMRAYLSKLGIDLSREVAHGFFNYDPVYIIGASPSEPKAPQLWIDKRTNLPLRENGAEHEIYFDKWTMIQGLSGKKFPSIITSTKDGKVEKLSLSLKIDDITRP